MKNPRKNWLALRMVASRGAAGMWAALMLALLSLLMIINNFHIITFHFRESSFAHGGFTPVLNQLGGRIPRLEGRKDLPDIETRHVLMDDSKRLNASSDSTPITQQTRARTNLTVSRPPMLWTDSQLPADHLCQGFTFPPPPADKKRTGPRPCPVCYLPVEKAMKLMPASGVTPTPVLKHLTFVTEPENSEVLETGPGSPFGGHPSLDERSLSHTIRENMAVHCGFVRGSEPGVGTGYDISEEDRADMYKCGGVVVGSAIFGNFDDVKQPKNISQAAIKNICFFMFIDEETETGLINDGAIQSTDLQTSRKIGLWRVVVVKNMPYSDARRNGKIPKLLIHRLFPNARFSLWIDGKLELVVDPYQILERFLWRTGDSFAISRHYKRFDVFVEAEANKAAGKYDNVTIDAQAEFYRNEGLTPYTEDKLPITSDVPEGCVIIREHTPLSNLFGCLWFNEVDRFTSRDQISFAIVRDKIMAQVPWRVNMFLDCERRNFVVQGYHKDVLEQKALEAQLLNATAIKRRLKAKARLF